MTTAARAPKPDQVCAAAVEFARDAAVDVGGPTVGEHLAAHADGERSVTHDFVATVPGYTGWHWAVTVARASRSRVVTVDEVVLLPGSGALLAPAWVPWSERVRPGDLGPGDVLPAVDDDPRLVPAYASGDDDGPHDRDPQVAEVAAELGLGRLHVLSREGRLAAADRWQDGDNGPDSAMARTAPARCGTCGFYLLLQGALQAAFGVCGNEVAPADGRVVSVEYGCGAHSEAGVEMPSRAEPVGTVYAGGEVYEPVR